MSQFHINPASPEHYQHAIQHYPKPGPYPVPQVSTHSYEQDSVHISKNAHQNYQAAAAHALPHSHPQAGGVRGSAAVHRPAALEPGHHAPKYAKPAHPLSGVLHGAATAAKHVGGLTGGYLGKLIGKTVGNLVEQLSGSKDLGRFVGTAAGTVSGAAAGGVFGAVVPSFCPHGGALIAGISGAAEAFKALH